MTPPDLVPVAATSLQGPLVKGPAGSGGPALPPSPPAPPVPCRMALVPFSDSGYLQNVQLVTDTGLIPGQA